MAAAELYEIVKGTEAVWWETLFYNVEYGPYWRTLIEVGHALREYATLHPTRAAAMLLGCMVKWLGEREVYAVPWRSVDGALWGVWRLGRGILVCGTYPTQLAACAEAVRTLLREEAQ